MQDFHTDFLTYTRSETIVVRRASATLTTVLTLNAIIALHEKRKKYEQFTIFKHNYHIIIASYRTYAFLGAQVSS